MPSAAPLTARITSAVFVVALLVTTAALPGCGSDGPRVSIDLRTDLLPGTEFDSAAVFIDDEAFPSTSHIAMPAQRYTVGVRIAQETPALGSHDFRVALFRAGVEVTSRTITSDIRGDHAITAVISRDCRGVMCPGAGDSPGATACLGGSCVDPRCTPETPEFCEATECSGDDDCAPHPCAEALCAGACLYAPRNDRCAVSERCDLVDGCIPDAPVDAGMDSSFDSGRDGGTDAGADSGLDTGPSDAGTDAPPMCWDRWPDSPGDCNPRDHVGCAAGNCRPVRGRDEVTCSAPGAKGRNERCNTGECAEGFICVAATGGAARRCHPTCARGVDCTCLDGDDACWPLINLRYGACIHQCDPVALTGCSASENCYLAAQGPLCLPAGDGAALGENCTHANDCQPGLLCITLSGVPQCTQTCDLTDAPPGCICTIFGASTDWGFCQP